MKVVSCFLGFLLITFFSAANHYTVFEENGKVGLKNGQGEVLIPAQYQAIGWSDGKLSVVNNVTGYKINGLWGLINVGNHKVTKATFEEILPGEGSLLIARKKSSLSLRQVEGCITTEGKEVIPFEYDGIKLSSLRAIVFTKSGNLYKYGLIDLGNKTLIPQHYKSIRSIGSLRYAVENFDRKTALFTDIGKQITAFTIDSISTFTKNYAIIYQDLQQGLIDREGQIKLEPTYREIMIQADGTIKTRQADEWCMLDGRNKLLQKTLADRIEPIGQNLLKIDLSGKILLTDQQLKPITSSTFSSLGAFENNKAVFSQQMKQGIIRKNGSIVLAPTYATLLQDREFLLAKQRQEGRDRWMLLDSLGHQLSSKMYDNIQPFNGKYFAVQHRGYWGALNFSGKEVLACSYDSLIQAVDQLIVVKFRGQYGIMSLNDEWKVTPRANRIKLINANRFIEKTPRSTFLKSIDNQVIYFTDNRLEITSDRLLEYLPSGTLWTIDLDGRIVDRKIYPDAAIEKIFEESEGLRAIQKNGRFGFIDSQGRLRIANRYEGVQKFSEGFAPAMIRGRWGYINREDNIAIQPAYEEVGGFKNGFALVKQKGFYGLINKQGVQVLPARYETIEVLPGGNLLIQQDKLIGLADAKGKTLIQPRYHHLQETGNGYAIAERDGKYGVLTLQAVSTIPLTYDYITYDPFNQVFLAMKKATWADVKLP
jgi:hypothetical protein